MRFSDTLDKTVDDFERPLLPPVGTYLATNSRAYEINTSADGKWDTMNFPLRLNAPHSGVDIEALEAYGDLSNAFIRKSVMMDTEGGKAAQEKAEWEMRQYFEACGVPTDLTVKEALAALVGTQVLVDVGYRQDKRDGETMFLEVKKFYSVE